MPPPTTLLLGLAAGASPSTFFLYPLPSTFYLYLLPLPSTFYLLLVPSTFCRFLLHSPLLATFYLYLLPVPRIPDPRAFSNHPSPNILPLPSPSTFPLCILPLPTPSATALYPHPLHCVGSWARVPLVALVSIRHDGAVARSLVSTYHQDCCPAPSGNL